MKKYILLSAFILIMAACSNSTIPLPPEAKQTNTPCPKEILHLGGTCYSVPKSHNETITWYENKANIEGWTFKMTTDDEPFSFVVTTNKKKAILTFYRQKDEKNTGIMIRMR